LAISDRLARIAHDPQHVCQRQLAGCGCFLPHFLICKAGRSLGAASALPFIVLSRGGRTAGRYPVHLYYNTVRHGKLAVFAFWLDTPP
jgi:hypothetical protein